MVIEPNVFGFDFREEKKEILLYGKGMRNTTELGIKFVDEFTALSEKIVTKDYTLIIDCRDIYFNVIPVEFKKDYDISMGCLELYADLGYINFEFEVLPYQDKFLQLIHDFRLKRPKVLVKIKQLMSNNANSSSAFQFFNDMIFKCVKVTYDALRSDCTKLSAIIPELHRLYEVVNPQGYTLYFKVVNSDAITEKDRTFFFKEIVKVIAKYNILGVELEMPLDFSLDFLTEDQKAYFKFL